MRNTLSITSSFNTACAHAIHDVVCDAAWRKHDRKELSAVKAEICKLAPSGASASNSVSKMSSSAFTTAHALPGSAPIARGSSMQQHERYAKTS
jgi:hypothetical protein